MKILKILFSIGLITLILIFALLYFKIFDPLWNPFRANPDKIIKKARENFSQLNSFHSDLEIEIIMKNEGEKRLDAKFLIDKDRREIKNQKTKTDFNINFAEGKEEYSLSGQDILIGKDNFIKFEKFPLLDFLTRIGFLPNEIKDRWIKLDLETTRELLETLQEEIGIEGLVENFERSKFVQEETEKKLKDLLAGKEFYLVKKELPDEKINGKKFYHYVLILNRKEIKKILPDLMKIYSWAIFNLLPENFQPPPQDKERIVADLTEKIDQTLEKIGETEFEIFIEKKELLIYKINLKKEIDLAEFDGGGSLILKLNINFSDFNKKFDLIYPAEFSTIKEIFEEIFRPMISWIQSQKRDEQRKKDMEKIKEGLDAYYNLYKNYPVSKTMPSEIKIKIDEKEECIFENCQRPKDPGQGPCPDYQWIPNFKNPQKFCAFACLENGKFFAVSNKGIRELEEAPKTLDCW
jgi:hypothetical protein